MKRALTRREVGYYFMEMYFKGVRDSRILGKLSKEANFR